MANDLQRPRKPAPGTKLVTGDGTMAATWADYFNRLEDYLAALEARIAALEP